MGQTAMVGIDIVKGSELVEALEQAKVKVRVALWAYLSEYEDWRLVLAAPQFDSPGQRDAYGYLHDLLAPAGFTPRNTPSIVILPTTDSFVRELRRVYGKAKSVEGTRIGGQLIGDRFVEDAYVYRVS